MKRKILLYIFFIFIIFQKNLLPDEININSSKMKVTNEGNIITAINVNADIPKKNIEIEGDKAIYDKKNSQLTIINNAKFTDKSKNIYLEGKKIIYNQITDVVQTFGETYNNIENNYDVYSSNLFYERKSQKIYRYSENAKCSRKFKKNIPKI